MPRSLGIFRRLDWPVVAWPVVAWPVVAWPVVAWPVDYRTTGDDLELQVGVGQRLDEIDHAMREWMGLVAYRLMGRTDALFPAP